MERIAVYGSLRKGCYNNRWLGNAKYIETFTVTGFALYDLGFYPAAVEQKGSSIVIEIWEVDDDTFKRIDNMEIGAGYIQRKLLID